MEAVRLPTNDGHYAEVSRHVSYDGEEFVYSYANSKTKPQGDEEWAIVEFHQTLLGVVSSTLGQVLWEDVPPQVMIDMAQEEGPLAFEALQVIASAFAANNR